MGPTFEDGLASVARTIALARPELRLRVFENQLREATGWIERGGIDKRVLVDRFYQIAVNNDLVGQHGVDRIQQILAGGLAASAEKAMSPNGDAHVHAGTREKSSREKQAASLAFDVVADIEAKAIDWVWRGRLARRKLTLIAGDPGLGKSQITADVAARISVGADWPDHQGSASKGSTVILSAEDGVADTLRPRLEVAGADLHLIRVVRSVVGPEGARRTFSLQSDLIMLGEKIALVGDVQLVVIDPITSYMGKIDSHRTTDVRAVLEPLSDFAEQHEVAVLAITHPPKATQAKALHAITGSLAFVAAARLVFIAIEEADTDRRLLLPVKSNIGVMARGLGFRLQQATTTNGIVTSRVVWDNTPVTITANEAVRAAAEQTKGDDSLSEAEEFLRSTLADGPVTTKEVQRQADAAGITKRTLRRARARLGVIAGKSGFTGKWMLRLPKKPNGGRP